MTAHTVQRPLEQLVERLLLCHGCLLCSGSPLIAASVCFCSIKYTSLLEHFTRLAHIDHFLLSTSRRHPLAVSHAVASKRQQIKARAAWGGTLIVKSKPRGSSNFALPSVPVSHPPLPQTPYLQCHSSGRLCLWHLFCLVSTWHLGVVALTQHDSTTRKSEAALVPRVSQYSKYSIVDD